MHVEVHLHPIGGHRDLDLPSQAQGLDLLTTLKLAPDAHILVRGETPIPEDEVLQDGDRIRVIAVVSGG